MDVERLALADWLAEQRDRDRMPVHEGVRVVWHVPPTLPTVRTDPAKLRIVLDNLVNNAIKFTSRGAITVGARQLVDRDAVEIVVEDTGPGIPKAELARIFEPFHQAAGGQDHPHGGVGLGLAIVERYVGLLAPPSTSVPAVGTRFALTHRGQGRGHGPHDAQPPDGIPSHRPTRVHRQPPIVCSAHDVPIRVTDPARRLEGPVSIRRVRRSRTDHGTDDHVQGVARALSTCGVCFSPRMTRAESRNAGGRRDSIRRRRRTRHAAGRIPKPSIMVSGRPASRRGTGACGRHLARALHVAAKSACARELSRTTVDRALS